MQFSPPPNTGQIVVNIENVHKLDGKTIARAVTKHQVDAAMYPRRSPNFDSYRNWTPPDAGFQPA